MRWKAKYTKSAIPHKTTRLMRKFAWLPTYIAGSRVWLETYEILQAYLVEEIELSIENEEPVYFLIGYWKNISKRII